MVLKGVQNTLYMDGLERTKIQRVSSMEILMLSIEGSSMEVEVLYNSNVMVLKEVNLMLFSTVYISDGLEMSQFCSYTQYNITQYTM